MLLPNGTTLTLNLNAPNLVPVPGNYDPYEPAPSSFSGTLTTGSPTVTFASTTGLYAGETVSGGGIPDGTTILTVDSATSVTLSANATTTGTSDLTVIFSFTGVLTYGSAVVDVTSTTGLVIGESVTGSGIPGGATIQAINAGTSITLSANSTTTGSVTLTAGGWVENIEAAVFDANTGVYTILGPDGTYTVSSGFQANDVPVPADYLGAGSTQPVVFRPSTGQFIAAGGTVIATFAGASADVPLAGPLSYRMPADPPTNPTTTGTGGGTGTTGTGTGTTGTGTGTTGTGTGTTGTGTGSGGQGSATPTPTPSPSPTSTVSPSSTPVASSKKKSKKVAPKKVAKKPKEKKVEKKTSEKKVVKVVKHTAKKVVKVVASHAELTKKPTHLVDIALAGVTVKKKRA